MKTALKSLNFTKYQTVGNKWNLVLYFCGIGGVLLNVFGLFLTGLEFSGFIEKAQKTIQLADLLMIVSFLMLMFACHALDKLSEIKPFESSAKP